MSLLAWYKLDGNTKNSGISDHSLTTVTGVTTDGFSYQFDGTSNCQMHGTQLTSHINHRSFSLCAWVKTSGLASGMTQNTVLCIGYGLTFNTDNNYISMRITDRTSSTSGTSIGCIIEKSIIDNNWHNIVGTYNHISKIAKIYCDGKLLNTVSSVNNNIYYTNEVYIGRNCNVSDAYFNGSIRDVRIYDNCLSDVEVKDIAKGLILHYDFNEPFEPYTNLCYNDKMYEYNNFTYNNNATVTKETLTNETYKGAPIYRLHFTINNETGLNSSTATSETNILADFKTSLGSHGIRTYNSYTFKANTKYCYQIYWRAITHKKNMIVGGSASNSGNWTAISSQKIDDEWNITGEYRDGSITSDKLDTLFTSFKNTDFKVGEEIIIDFAAPMLVEGKTTFTDFSIYDASYDGIVYDVSGFNNNAIIESQDYEPNYVKDDSIIGGSYAKFNGNGADQITNSSAPGSRIKNNSFYFPKNNFTIATWIKVDGPSYDTHPLIFISLFNTSNINDGSTYSKYGISNYNSMCRFNLTDGTNASSIFFNSSSTPAFQTYYTDYAWHYVVFTMDNYNHTINWYDNGKLILSQSFTDGYNLTVDSISKFYIGFDYAGGGNRYLNGRIADYKIYVTALSADDILKLYKSRFEIDNAQKLLVNTIKENTVDNLVYNGDFHNGNLTNNTKLSILNSDVFSNIIKPNNSSNINQFDDNSLFKISNKDTYEISFDFKLNELNITNGAILYFSLISEDTNRNSIFIYNILKYKNTNTTLASDLKNGDTTAILTDSSNWNTDSASQSYKKIGICNNFIWGYDRSTVSLYYTSISNNTLTLQSAYTGSTISAGTKVANFSDWNSWIYPVYIDLRSLNLDIWYHKSIIIDFSSYNENIDNNDARIISREKFLSYAYISIRMYNNVISIANLKIRNVSNPQNLSMVSDTINLDKTQLLSSGNAYSSSEFSEVGIPIRYIRDSINGNTVNTINAWQEIEAFNDVGNNIAYNKKVKMTSESSFTLRACASGDLITTDPNYSNQSYISGEATTNPYIVMDLEFIEVVTKIKVWHYYNDGRTYHNHKIEVSADGTNWITVYDSDITGEVAETADGIEVILDADKVRMFKQGQVSAHEFIER